MKEESRIEALEHELKILKNEIHATLLEIREQILNHYYPELRAEEPLRNHALPVRQTPTRPGVPVAKSTPRAQEVNVTRSEIEAKGQIQPFSDIFLEDLSDDDLTDDQADVEVDDAGIDALITGRHATVVALDENYDEDEDDGDDGDYDDEDDENDEEIKVRKIVPAPREGFGVTPQTREVDFRQMKQAAASQTPTPASAPKANRANFSALATWVSDGVSTVGKARTTQIVETYASGGKLTTETKSSLLQLISLAGEDEPAKPAGTQEMLAIMVGLDQILGQG